MIHLLVRFAVFFVVFGVTLTWATKKVSGVSVEPRKALPFVAFVLTLLNWAPYLIIKGAINLFTLGAFFFLAPFVANAVILWVADKYLKPFKIDGLVPLAILSVVMAGAHAVVWALFHVI